MQHSPHLGDDRLALDTSFREIWDYTQVVLWNILGRTVACHRKYIPRLSYLPVYVLMHCMHDRVEAYEKHMLTVPNTLNMDMICSHMDQ